MATERASRRKFTQLVSDHILGNVHGNELISVMHSNSLTHKIRRNHRSSRPSLYRNLLVRLLCLYYSFLQFMENIRTFL